MDDWEGLRTAAVIVAWAAVAGGLPLAGTRIAVGGRQAIGPDDELAAQSRLPMSRSDGRYTAFSTVQVGIRGLLGIATAGLLTYAAARPDRPPLGYLAVLAVAAVTVVVGPLTFRKWRSGRRPARDANRPVTTVRTSRTGCRTSSCPSTVQRLPLSSCSWSRSSRSSRGANGW